jgi:hypothetical protein
MEMTPTALALEHPDGNMDIYDNGNGTKDKNNGRVV